MDNPVLEIAKQRYRSAWAEYRTNMDPDIKKMLEKEMDAAQDFFTFDEFQEFKVTLEGFVEYWSFLTEDALRILERRPKNQSKVKGLIIMTIEELVKEYPGCEQLIRESIAWLDKTEPTWELDGPLDRHRYIANLITHVTDRPDDRAKALRFLGENLMPELDVMNAIQQVEKALNLGKDRPRYHYEGREVKWGEDLTDEVFKAMFEDAEVFLLRDSEDKPHSWVIRDGYGTIMQQKIIEDNHEANTVDG